MPVYKKISNRTSTNNEFYNTIADKNLLAVLILYWLPISVDFFNFVNLGPSAILELWGQGNEKLYES